MISRELSPKVARHDGDAALILLGIGFALVTGTRFSRRCVWSRTAYSWEGF